MLENLTTERRNPKTKNLDQLSIHDFLQIMNDEDKTVALAVEKVLPMIEKTVVSSIWGLERGGRIVYIGAGTSGRLGVLDAVECPPTFGTTYEVMGLIAGGDKAFVKAVEGAEDSEELAINDLKEIKLNENDIVIGIAASGRTPYVIGGLKYAKSVGASTTSISCNLNAEISKYAENAIEVDCGPEVLTGSTRLKAGTSQKLILNMISTASMIGIGKVYGNLMVDVMATNEKLVDRSKRIIMEATDVTYEEAEKKLEESNGSVKKSIVMILTNSTLEEAEIKLKNANGSVRKTL